MTNEEKLDAIYKMTLENHEVLKTIRRQQYLATAGRLFYWLIVIGVIGGAYYYVKPFVDRFTVNPAQAQEALNQFDRIKNQFPETKVFNQILEGFKHPEGEQTVQ